MHLPFESLNATFWFLGALSYPMAASGNPNHDLPHPAALNYVFPILFKIRLIRKQKSLKPHGQQRASCCGTNGREGPEHRKKKIGLCSQSSRSGSFASQMRFHRVAQRVDERQLPSNTRCGSNSRSCLDNRLR